SADRTAISIQWGVECDRSDVNHSGGCGAPKFHSNAEYRADCFRPELSLRDVRGKQLRLRDSTTCAQLQREQRSWIWPIRDRGRRGRRQRQKARTEQHQFWVELVA